jgi:hypothetical protein
LDESGIGLPPYLKWGRTHSGCFFCFFQRPIEWVRLLETHPDQFEEAMKYEKSSSEPGKSFTWIQGMPLSELRKPETVTAIKKKYEDHKIKYRETRKNKKLIEVFTGVDDDDEDNRACLICQL